MVNTSGRALSRKWSKQQYIQERPLTGRNAATVIRIGGPGVVTGGERPPPVYANLG
jgi:hypothetical protein